MGTTLFCTVLYKKRRLKEANEKICPQRTHRQTDKERAFQKLKSTLFLYGSSPDTRGSWPILYNTLNYAIVSRHQINTCTVLYSSVLYCIKRGKFADRQGTQNTERFKN